MKKINAVFAALSMIATPVLAEGLRIGAGLDYTTGNYGSPDKTEILYIPFAARYETGPWTLRAVVPYVEITGPGNVVGAGADRIVVPGASTARRTDKGLGDIVGSAFYSVLDETKSAIGLDLGAKVKLGTADSGKGLGTGENDYSVQADLFKPLGGPWTAFATLGYRWYGDPPGVDLRNIFYSGIGATYKASSATSFGAAYDWRPSAAPGGPRTAELTGFATQRLTREWRAQFYGIKGFADGSPDWGVGALLSYSFQ